jgi:hypothetical protein
MTIKIEREALLRVLSRAPSLPKSPRCDRVTLAIPDDEFVMVELPNATCCYSDDCLVEKLRDTYATDDDCTVTTLSSSSSFSDVDERRVTFADPLVTEVWTRPWTPVEDREKLFYSIEETQRFRHEYRLERKLCADFDVGADRLAVDDEQSLKLLSFSSATSNKASRHCISRVVVLHNDKFETFFHPEAIGVPSQKDTSTADDFFDNDSFWSGSITWY